MSGLPKTVILSPEEVREAIDEQVVAVIDSVIACLGQAPPELTQYSSSAACTSSEGAACCVDSTCASRRRRRSPCTLSDRASRMRCPRGRQGDRELRPLEDDVHGSAPLAASASCGTSRRPRTRGARLLVVLADTRSCRALASASSTSCPSNGSKRQYRSPPYRRLVLPARMAASPRSSPIDPSPRTAASLTSASSCSVSREAADGHATRRAVEACDLSTRPRRRFDDTRVGVIEQRDHRCIRAGWICCPRLFPRTAPAHDRVTVLGGTLKVASRQSTCGQAQARRAGGGPDPHVVIIERSSNRDYIAAMTGECHVSSSCHAVRGAPGHCTAFLQAPSRPGLRRVRAAAPEQERRAGRRMALNSTTARPRHPPGSRRHPLRGFTSLHRWWSL